MSALPGESDVSSQQYIPFRSTLGDASRAAAPGPEHQAAHLPASVSSCHHPPAAVAAGSPTAYGPAHCTPAAAPVGDLPPTGLPPASVPTASGSFFLFLEVTWLFRMLRMRAPFYPLLFLLPASGEKKGIRY